MKEIVNDFMNGVVKGIVDVFKPEFNLAKVVFVGWIVIVWIYSSYKGRKKKR